jgi:glycosyltransferase involved in cell wall biosynthesis
MTTIIRERSSPGPSTSEPRLKALSRMLENRDMVVMSGDWGRSPNAIQHITEIFATRNRVLWVSGVPIRAPRLRVRDLRRILDKGRKMLGGTVRVESTPIPVTEVHPKFIPFYDLPMIRRFNDHLLRELIVAKTKELGFKNFILFATNPMAAGVVGTLGEASSHYACIDDYGANEGAFRCLKPLEQEILEKVDSSWSMSDVLLKTRIPKSRENHFFPEGVNLNHFRPTSEPAPAGLAGIKRPIVGYCGLLAWWVDIELIARCAQAYPDVSFVILGEAKVDISILKAQSNIFCPGYIPYDVLPRYMEQFDVGLIPRHINRLTLAMNPLKLLEYFAMGMPVVSSALPEVRKFADHVYLAEDRGQFVRMVGEALKDKSPVRRDARLAVAREFSWHKVVEDMSRVMTATEAKKARSIA